MAAELVRILDILEGHAIEIIPYRGPVLGEFLYGSVARRSFLDLDLLLSRQGDILGVKRALRAAGYFPACVLPAAAEAAYLESSCVYEFEGSATGICVEVHWKNSRHPALPLPSEFLESLERKSFFRGKQILTLPPETMLLLLCAHGTKHGWQRLRQISDVADLVRRAGDIDWGRLLQKADQLGARCMVLTGLSLAHHLLAAPVPDEVLWDIRKNQQVERIVMERSEEVFQSQEEHGYWNICRFNLRSFDNWHGRLRYLTRMVLRPGIQDFKAASLPRFLFPLYPCIRLFRLIFGGRRGKRARQAGSKDYDATVKLHVDPF